MPFDEQTRYLLTFDPLIKPNHKLVLLALSQCDNQTITTEWLAKGLKIARSSVVILFKELISLGNIQIVNKEITFKYDTQEAKILWKDCSIGIVRKPRLKNSIIKARAKLDQLRMVGFVGQDSLIVHLAREYDACMLKYVGIKTFSVPPNYTRAIKSVNWIHFKRLHQLLVDRSFPSKPYLEVQFKAMKSNGKSGKVYPYPSMLYGNWAIKNYIYTVQDSQIRQVEENLFLDEHEVIREVLASSNGIVQQLLDTNEGLSELQAILLVQDSLSPIYLASHPEYLKHTTEYELELPEDLTRVLVRLNEDKQFKQLVKQTIQEISHGS